MDEMYFDMGKGTYIKIVEDELEINDSYVDTQKKFHKNEVMRDKIENFRLLNFSIIFGCNVSIYLVNEKKGFFYRRDLTLPSKQAKKFETFKNIMEEKGVFEKRNWFDVNHGEYSFEHIRERLIKELLAEEKDGGRPKEFSEDQKEQEQISDEERFYKKIKELPGFDAPTEKEEINYLRTVLRENEQVFIAVSGSMEVGIGLLVCTDQRILFLKSAMFSGMNCLEIMLDKINSVSCGGGLSVGKVIIQDGAGKHEISSMKKETSELFAKIVRDTMHEQKKEEKVVAQNQTASTADELLKYKQLLDMGAITEEEFTKLKSDLIK